MRKYTDMVFLQSGTVVDYMDLANTLSRLFELQTVDNFWARCERLELDY